VPRPPPTAASVERAALLRIDQLAGELRLRYITDVPGQQAVYLTKLDEATRYLQQVQQGQTGLAGPHLQAEAAALGVTALVVAQSVSASAALWLGSISPAIEAQRMAGKAAVRAAATLGAKQAALGAAEAALFGAVDLPT
jgi:hypothetical protein